MRFPAVDVRGANPEFALAVADDFSPSAVEDLPDGIAIFFRTTADRDGAHDALGRAFPSAAITAREVDDEDWARRSQQNLTPITVGQITVLPPWARDQTIAGDRMPVGDRMSGSPSASDGSPADAIALVIAPSMGFGTGHHATTRLCLAALQTIPLEGRQVLDVGTGSGVLAIAARMLGAADVLGIDVDPDAIVSARENLELNPSVTRVGFDVADLQDHDLHGSDVVLANLTGATLVQHARTLSSQVKRGGVLIVSGLLDEERDSVLDAFGEYSLFWSQSESGWTGLALSAD